MHQGEDVLLAGLRTLQWADNVDSYHPEGLANNRKRNKWCPIMTQNTGGALTWFTGGTILCDILKNRRPPETEKNPLGRLRLPHVASHADGVAEMQNGGSSFRGQNQLKAVVGAGGIHPSFTIR
eukprot:scpid99826/ scgid32285/ 